MAIDLENSVLVYDVGGGHVLAAVCLSGACRLGPVVSAPHPAKQTSDAFIHLLYSLGVKASTGGNGVGGAELAVPCPFDFEAGISHLRRNLPYLYGVDLRGKLAEHFGWQPTQVRFLLNSAAFLLGEIGSGEARGVERAAGITLGTGIGSAFAVDGRVAIEGQGYLPAERSTISPAKAPFWRIAFRPGPSSETINCAPARRRMWPGLPPSPPTMKMRRLYLSISAAIWDWRCVQRWPSSARRWWSSTEASRALRISSYSTRSTSWRA